MIAIIGYLSSVFIGKKERETEEVMRVKNNGGHVTLSLPDWS